MAVAERTLALKLIADVNGLKPAQRRLGSFTRGVTSWGKALTGGLVIGGMERLAGAIGDNIAAIKEQDRLLAQTKAVLRSTGRASGQTAKGIVRLSEAIEDMSGIDQEAVQNAENLLLTFTKIKGPIFEQATRAVVDMSVALGTDMKGASIQVGKALNDPIKGVTALQRVGVSFTQKQKDTIKRLVETGRVMDAQKLILRELAKEFGGSAAAAGRTFEGQLARIGQAWGDVIQGFVRGDFKGVAKGLSKVGGLVEDLLFGGAGKDGIRNSKTKGLVNQFGAWAQKLADSIAAVDWGKSLGDALRAAVDGLSKAGENGTLSTLATIGAAIAAAIFAADLFFTAATTLFSLPKWAAKSVVGIAVSAVGAALGGVFRTAMFIGETAVTLMIAAAAGAFSIAKWGAKSVAGIAVAAVGSALGGVLRGAMFLTSAFVSAAVGLLTAVRTSSAVGIAAVALGRGIGVALRTPMLSAMGPVGAAILAGLTLDQFLTNIGWGNGTQSQDRLDKLYDRFGWDKPGNNANGTAGWRGGPTWVGERGPEVVIPPRGSRIMDARRSAASVGGPVVHVTVHAGIGTNGAQLGRDIYNSALRPFLQNGGYVQMKSDLKVP